MAECGFCGDKFENVTAKLVHQENFCDDFPKTRSDNSHISESENSSKSEVDNQ